MCRMLQTVELACRASWDDVQRMIRFGSFVLAILLANAATATTDCGCPPLGSPSAGDTVVSAGTLAELQAHISNASGPTTILLEDGIYSVTTDSFVNVSRDEITIRSRSGDRSAVIIEGQGMAAAGQYGHGIYVAADKVTIADLTVRQTQHHGIFVTPGSDDCRIYNVVVIDTGEQLIKASGGTDQAPKNGGSVACSWIGYSDTLDDGDDGWYTNGIDLLNSHGWRLRNNTFRHIRHHPGLTTQLTGPAILVWQGSGDTLVEGNRIIDCDLGIAFGNSSGSGVQHSGGVIRNNTIKGYSGSDVGIGLVRAVDALVEHNTVYSPGGVYGYSIEADQPETTGGIIRNNFSDEPILADRRGASATISDNRSDAQAEDFVDADNGDLHLAADASAAIDAGVVVGERSYDLDCDRISGGAPDLGADEWIAADGDTPGDPADPVPDPTPTANGSGHGSGCFINTATTGASPQADAQTDIKCPSRNGASRPSSRRAVNSNRRNIGNISRI